MMRMSYYILLVAMKFDSSLCMSDINLVFDVHVLKGPARPNRNALPRLGSVTIRTRVSFQYINILYLSRAR